MTSSRRRPDRPIESVELTISFNADRETSRKVREAFPAAKLKGSSVVLTLQGTEPRQVEDALRQVLEKVRQLEGKK